MISRSNTVTGVETSQHQLFHSKILIVHAAGVLSQIPDRALLTGIIEQIGSRQDMQPGSRSATELSSQT